MPRTKRPPLVHVVFAGHDEGEQDCSKSEPNRDVEREMHPQPDPGKPYTQGQQEGRRSRSSPLRPPCKITPHQDRELRVPAGQAIAALGDQPDSRIELEGPWLLPP